MARELHCSTMPLKAAEAAKAAKISIPAKATNAAIAANAASDNSWE